MNSFGRTDAGRVRPNNQDAFVCGRLSETTVFAVVCDGMGGANGGNIASAMAVRLVSQRLVENYREGLSESSLQNLLESAVAAANAEIYDTAAEDETLAGMGTTLIAAVANETRATVAYIGDSRAYLIKGGELTQLTRDHSVVQDMLEKGQLTEQEAKNHPRKHFLTRALGVEQDAEADFIAVDFLEDGMLMICTDGLTNMADEKEISRVIAHNPPHTVPDRLIAAANMHGGSDNITVAVITHS